MLYYKDIKLRRKKSYIKVRILTLAKVLAPWQVLIELSTTLAELYTP